jgi:hypothetical protein
MMGRLLAIWISDEIDAIEYPQIFSLDGAQGCDIFALFWFGIVSDKPDNGQKGYRQIALATTIPLIMVAAPAVGYFIGRFLDRLLGTKNVLTVIFLLLGVVAGGVEAYRLIKEIDKENN